MRNPYSWIDRTICCDNLSEVYFFGVVSVMQETRLICEISADLVRSS